MTCVNGCIATEGDRNADKIMKGFCVSDEVHSVAYFICLGKQEVLNFYDLYVNIKKYWCSVFKIFKLLSDIWYTLLFYNITLMSIRSGFLD
jgi:hypothetical protein